MWFSVTFESVDEIIWCDHSNEIPPAVLSHVNINFVFRQFENGIWDFCDFFFVLLWPPLGVKGRGKEGRKAFCMKT